MAANVIQFTIHAVETASGPMGRVGKVIGGVAKAALAAAAAAVAAATAVVAFTAASARAMDVVAKFSQRLGIAVDKLTAYQFAANISGIKTEQFNLSLQRMERRVSEASKGFGEARGAIAELGLTAANLATLTPDQKLEVLADRISKVTDQATRVRIAFKLFDTEGVSMLQLLQNGSEGMRKLTRDAAFLGVTLSAQTVANAEKFNDSMTRARGAIKGVSSSVSAELFPVLTGLANMFADSLARSRGSIAAFVRGAIVDLVAFGIIVGQVFDRIGKFFSKLFTKEGFNEFIDSAQNAAVAIGEIFARLAPALGAVLVASFKVAMDTLFELGVLAFQKLFDAITGQDLAGTLADALFDSIPAATEEAREVISRALGDVGDIAVETSERAGAALAEGLGLNLEAARLEAEALIASIEQFGTVAEDQTLRAAEAALTFSSELRRIADEFRNTQVELATELAQNVFDISMNTAGAIGEAFAQTVVEGENLMEGLRNVAKGVLKQVIAMLVKIGAQRLVLAALSTASIAKIASTEMAQGLAQTFVNAFKSTAAIPIVGPALAPGVAAASVAAAAAGATASGATGAALGATIAGAAHGGLDFVPREQTMLLDRGERVLSPEQNRELTDFIRGGGGGRVTIERVDIRILENATNAQALLEMDPNEMRRVVSGPILDALNALDRMGVRPNFIERRNRGT